MVEALGMGAKPLEGSPSDPLTKICTVASPGIHPVDVTEMSSAALVRFRKMLVNPQVVMTPRAP